MPGVYTPPDYDLAGFIVGVVDEDGSLGPTRVRVGDVVVGLASSGLHTNGYSLARRIVGRAPALERSTTVPGDAVTVADVLLRVHRSYLAALRPVLGDIHAMAHITGGGLPGNVPRALPPTIDAEIETRAGLRRRSLPFWQKPAGSDARRCFARSTWASAWWSFAPPRRSRVMEARGPPGSTPGSSDRSSKGRAGSSSVRAIG